MKLKLILVFLCAGVVGASLFQAQKTGAGRVPAVAGLPPAARAAAESIDPEKIRAHVRFLSLDLLEGRGPGTRGGELAAEYIATQFALEGVNPAGDNGTYFQRVPLYAVHTVEDKTKFEFAVANAKGGKGRRRRFRSPMGRTSWPRIRPGRPQSTWMRPLSL